MPNIYQNIDSNKRQTFFVVTAFVVVVSALGWFIGEFFTESGGLGLIPFALIFSGVSGLLSYYNSDKIVLSISGAKEVNFDEAPDVHKLVENMSIASGLPKPKVYIIDDTSMNAFATGRDPEHGVICFTTGIIQRLEKRELEGVIAHEMSHIGNYDIRLMSIVSVLVGTITLLADWFTRGRLYRSSNKRNSEGSGLILLIGVVFLILSPIIATLIKLALSRNREYLADSTAALITRYPAGLAGALKKLTNDEEILEAANGATAHLYIVSPIRAGIGRGAANLFSTHPPIEERIRRLESM
ncbi:zinc metalloprotease HtpX [candidate division WWE3 bacterium RIFOXYC1_FULL_40_10]|uniref:Protease HtpX homolog n=1 Tax=candidate division WWE3 bacterium RIFOXYA2_FULL_46_9 TaxID=1802636 RepID=A0A1F4W2R0_UNCKA|nr:MAG: zinc metalloprotease HtpX [candidate division WWE3 bacterium RIFOXYB1_FULL_40_22]OGC61720.1 MAG: zinc metalloprotease HtpX [candidate division WWE3 bacterium RIFOXYA1_FULL_40_11]OGC63704.1 MAG: zinc metalloprotease HtpX [candidate division WWE3 bacterium RIFOXYA2_FULL_46_9]OGC66103.1 MAG: zinc metalloprotease HtpX [candidate division WWE3 bacterium RIFOXYC1_FULL_40_10]OGC67502.1 MAG: zinc metalloprotease HtpX [candidate division WWE3 bacterium RIFOXYC2_FULL_40_11]OGC70380.1 MAG: zinc m